MTDDNAYARARPQIDQAGTVPEHELEDIGATYEQRAAPRDGEVCVGISSFTMMNNGSYLEGVVKDVSDGGARIAGEVVGLSVGQNVDLGLVIRDEKIRYSCTIIHIDPETKSYGLKFLSGPRQIVVEDPIAKRCVKCRTTYDPDLHYCSICGSELTRPKTY